MRLRTLWLSLDPYMRGRMSDAPSYAKSVGIGDVMEGGTVSEVVASNLPRFAKGDIVVGRTGWQTHALSDGSSLQKVDPTRAPIQTALGVLGMPSRLGCRPDRPDQGCLRRWHRRRTREMPTRDRGTRL